MTGLWCPCGNMRIAHAYRPGPTQPHERRHRRRTPRRSSTLSSVPPPRGADLLVTPEMAIPGYCIGDLVEDAGFLAANERALQRVAAAATLPHRRRRLHRSPSGGAQRQRHDAQVQRRGGRGGWTRALRAPTSRCCRTTATSTTSAISHPRARATRSTSPLRGRSVRLGVSICEDMWDEYYPVKPLPELGGEGRGASWSTSTRRLSIPASGTSAMRSSASTSRGSASRSST